MTELIGIGIPCCTPPLRNHLLTTYIYLNISGIIEDEVILCILGSFDKALINHLGAIQQETFRQILDTSVLYTVCHLRGGRRVELVIEGVFVTNQALAILVRIGSRQMAFPTLLVIQLEGTVQLLVVIRITPTAIAVTVPQESIVLVGQHERYAHLGIILEQVFVQPLHVQFLRLMLSETIESLIFRTVEKHAPGKSVALFLGHLCHINTNLTVRHAESFESLSILCLFQQGMTVAVIEHDSTRLFVDARFYVGCLHRNDITVCHHELRLGSLLHNYQALFLWQLALGRCLYPDDMVVDNLQSYHFGTSSFWLFDGNRHILAFYGIVNSHHPCCDYRQQSYYDVP